MKYMGSKASHAKEIIEIILKGVDQSRINTWVEPFVGGANIIDKVPLQFRRIGNDINTDLIEMFRAVQRGWKPPDIMSESEYASIKESPEAYPKELVAFTAIGCSYSGKWWGGYARGNSNKGAPRNYCIESKRNLLKQNIQDVKFYSGDYLNLYIPENSVIYCDPPYANTTGYKNSFNHDTFWKWCDSLIERGLPVFVSEYRAPDHWNSIWQKRVNNTLVKNTGSKQGTENLFTRERENI